MTLPPGPRLRVAPRDPRAGNLRLSIAALSGIAWLGLAFSANASGDAAKPARGATMQDVLDASTARDWRPLDPRNTLYMDLPAGRVVIELAETFAPLHAANIRTLARQEYFDGLAIVRVQDNFVTQWGDPHAGDGGKAKPFGDAKRTLAPEFTRPARGLPFTRLADGDVFAPEVGFSNGFPAARDAKANQAWITHCYGVVGAGRDTDPESGSGAELYVVIGHAPRQLDRNIAAVGRVVKGMDLLSALPRGPAPMGFYANADDRHAITSIRVAADVPADERTPLEILRTDTATFAALVEARRNRRDDWYHVPAGKIDVCNVPIPVREPAR